MERAQRSVRGAVDKMNALLGAIGAGISVSFLVDLGKKADEFRKSMALISTQIDDTNGELKQIEATAKRLATQFGNMPVEQSRAFYEILSAGIEDVTVATDLLTTANKLAVGGNTTLAVSVDGLTNIMNSYAGKVKDAEAVSDSLFIGMKAGKATMEELSSGLGKVTPIASSLNVSFDELVAAVSALSKQGIQTSESITGVRAILAAVAKPSSEAAKLANQLGLEFNAASIQAKGFSGFLEDVAKKTGGSTEKLALLFGGVESLVPMMALTGQAGTDFAQIMQDMGNKTGATGAAFEKAAVPGDAFRNLMASLSGIGITLGDTLVNWLSPAAGEAAKAFANIDMAMTGAGKSSSEFAKSAQIVNPIIKALAITGYTAVQTFNLLAETIGTAALQLISLANLDFKGVSKWGAQWEQTVNQSRLDFDKFVDTVMNGSKEMESSGVAAKNETKAVEQLASATKQVAVEKAQVSKATKAQISDSERFLQSLSKEAALFGKSSTEIKRMEAAQLGVLKSALPLIKSIEDQEKALKDADEAASRYKNQLSKAASIAESMMTDEERFAQTQAELNQLLNTGALDVETYNRALAKAQESLNKTKDTGKVAFNELDQFAVQAARNLQTSFADALANGLDGFDNFAKSVWSILKNLAAQIASAKILQGLGLGSALGLGSSSASASSGFDLMGIMKSGFGIPQALSGIGSSLPGSVGSFFSGMGGGTIPGVSSQSALMGTQFAEFAAPLAAMAIGTAIGSFVGGDKKVGGLNSTITSLIGSVIGGPLGGFIGGGINALFGRGPLKQKETFIDATLGAGGFESGILQTGFKAKGGLFRSDKRDFARVDLVSGLADTDNKKALQGFADQLAVQAKGIIQLFNDTAQATSSSLRSVADMLGLSTESLDNFSTHISLVSKSGEMLTEQQIADEINRISNEMVHSLVPGIDALSKSGESALQTVQRLGVEFFSLQNAAAVLSGSTQAATDAVRALSFEQRTAMIEAAGGADKLNQGIGFFADNFLSTQEKYDMEFAVLNEQLGKLGFSASMSKDDFTALIKSVTQAGGVSVETAAKLLELSPLFLQMIRDGEEIAKSAVQTIEPAVEVIDLTQDRLNAAASSFALLQRSVEAERSRITSDYNLQLKAANDRINAVTESINKLKSISSALSNTVDQINPMNIETARGQLKGALEQLKSGLVPDAGTLQNALNAVSNQSTSGFGSRLDFLRSQGQNLALVNSLSSAAGGRLTAEQQQLNALEAAREVLSEGFNSEMQRLDDILSNAKMQLDAINGINSSILSLAEAIRAFNRDASAAGAPSVSGSGVTDQQIKDYFKVARTPEEIAKDAARFGLSSERIAAAAGFTQEQVDQFFKDNPQLPRFASGTSFVPKTGAALVHKGERIINPQQNQDLVSTLKEVLSAVQISTVAQNKISRMFQKWDGDGMPQERTV
jgi:TP901 family phage tail tape measure protein